MNTQSHDEKLTNSLAVAMVEQPRGTLKELAEAAGISKATLHRFCGTRENLTLILLDKSINVLQKIKEISENPHQEANTIFEKLVNYHLEKKEILRFLCSIYPSEEAESWVNYFKSLECFFFHAQKKGIYRVDISAALLAEFFASIVCGVIDAERKGKIASLDLAKHINILFMEGILNKPK